MFNFKFLLLSIDLIFLPKVSPPKHRLLATFNPEILSKFFRCLGWFISIIKREYNIYLASTAETDVVVCPTIANMAAPWSARTLSAFLSLNHILYSLMPYQSGLFKNSHRHKTIMRFIREQWLTVIHVIWVICLTCPQECYFKMLHCELWDIIF